MILSWVDTIAIVKESEDCGGIYSLPIKTSRCVPTIIRSGYPQKLTILPQQSFGLGYLQQLAVMM
jgi:hypothetical protein